MREQANVIPWGKRQNSGKTTFFPYFLLFTSCASRQPQPLLNPFFKIILLSYHLAKTARSKTKMMPKSVAVMRIVENLKRTNKPVSKQKIQRARRKRTTQHLEKAQAIKALMHRKREITTTQMERVLVFIQ